MDYQAILVTLAMPVTIAILATLAILAYTVYIFLPTILQNYQLIRSMT